MMTQEQPFSKEFIGGVFGRAAPTYGQVGPPFFGYFGELLAERAGINPGDSLLDIATGRGAVLFPAAKLVGSTGHAIGTDLSKEMVSETQADIARQGFGNVEVQVMDAEKLDLADASFDVVTCSFGVMFFPNLTVALAEMKRVLRSGGRLAVTTWGRDDQRWAWRRELGQKYAAHTKVTGIQMQAQRLVKPEELREAIEAAGFTNVEVTEETYDAINADEETFWEATWSHGARAAFESMDSEPLAAYKADLFAVMQAQRETDGFHQLWTANVATARRP
jgi:ubiquinone/menaquinone biosynthesis C-methylase UbiE